MGDDAAEFAPGSPVSLAGAFNSVAEPVPGDER